jgi:hypothetical protein
MFPKKGPIFFENKKHNIKCKKLKKETRSNKKQQKITKNSRTIKTYLELQSNKR